MPYNNARHHNNPSLEGKEQMANETGKRYTCTTCGSEMIVTKGGEGSIMCCGKPMVKKT